jgi:transcriptional regulator with XRE-family HTH domain
MAVSRDRTAEGIGPVGRRLAANLRQIRAQRRVTTADLSEVLSDLGRPILPTGITKTEMGVRRVDGDDLVALAAGLDVTPSRLLLADVYDEQPIELTPRLTTSADAAWLWSAGEEPLPVQWAPQGPSRRHKEHRDRFRRENRPWGYADLGADPVLRSGEITSREVAARNVQAVLIAAAKSGMTAEALHKTVDVAVAVVNSSPGGTGPGEAR